MKASTLQQLTLVGISSDPWCSLKIFFAEKQPQPWLLSHQTSHTTWWVFLCLSSNELLNIHQKNLTSFSCRHSHTNVHNSLICNSPKLKTTKLSFSKRTVKQTVVYPYHELLLSNQNKWSIDNAQLGWNLKKFYEWRNSQSSKDMYCMISLMSYPWNNKSTEMKNRSGVCQGLRMEERGWVWLQRNNMEVSHGNGTVESFDCEAHYTKLHVTKLHRASHTGKEFMHNW